MQAEQLYQLSFLADLVAGPSQQPIFSVSDIETKEGQAPKYRTRLATWEGGLRYLTQSDARNPNYSGNWLYFIRKVDGVGQLFRMSLQGGEPEVLTHFRAGVEGYQVSPDGQHIALLSRGDYQAPKSDAPKTFEIWPVKFEARGLLPTEPRALYLWSEGQIRLLHQHPQDIEEVVWQQDRLLFTAAGTAQDKWGWKQTLYQIDLSGQVTALLGGVGPVSGLAVSPEGNVAYLAHAWENAGGTEARLVLRDPAGQSRVLYEGSLQNSVNSDQRLGALAQGPVFGPDGRIYLIDTYHGNTRLVAVNLQGQSEVISPANRGVAAFAWSGQTLWWLSESFTQGPTLEGPGVSFNPNQGNLDGLADPQLVEWQNPEGHRVQGWLLLPQGPGPHPVILYIHGGPHTAFGNALIFEMQLYRSAGYAVAFCNPKGSTGYGQSFTSLDGRWGEVDQTDLMGFLDACLQQFPLDPTRQGVAGGSYGGFMTNWLTANLPQRFKAAVTDRSICNWTSFWGASDIGPRFTGLELLASPWEQPDVLWQKSPLRLVQHVQTPTLVVHSEQDHRCPIDQGETWFTALLQRGVTTRFFRVPEEGHELSRAGRPDRRVARLQAYLEWWKNHL